MNVDQLLHFDSNSAFSELEETFKKVVNDLCETVLANADANLGGQYPEVAASLQSGLIDLAQRGLIEGQISTDDWEAFIAEWGSGSEMDTDNPDLQGYMESELWNPLRYGTTIVGRPAGTYMGLDGKLHTSSGKMAGRYLEHIVKPNIPLHFMRNALESNHLLIIDQLNAVLQTFDFGKFLI